MLLFVIIKPVRYMLQIKVFSKEMRISFMCLLLFQLSGRFAASDRPRSDAYPPLLGDDGKDGERLRNETSRLGEDQALQTEEKTEHMHTNITLSTAPPHTKYKKHDKLSPTYSKKFHVKNGEFRDSRKRPHQLQTDEEHHEMEISQDPMRTSNTSLKHSPESHGEDFSEMGSSANINKEGLSEGDIEIHFTSASEEVDEHSFAPPEEGKDPSHQGLDVYHGIPRELMPIVPGGGSKFDDIEIERERTEQLQSPGETDTEAKSSSIATAHHLQSTTAVIGHLLLTPVLILNSLTQFFPGLRPL